MAKIDTINRSLIALGEPVLASLAADVPNAERASKVYDDMLALLLASHRWNFALKSASLQKAAINSYNQYFKYAYPLPVDYLKLDKVGHFNKQIKTYPAFISDAEYMIMGKNILSDMAEGLDIRYIAKITDDTFYPPNFKEALVAVIAAKLANCFRSSGKANNEYQKNMAEYNFFIAAARRQNEIARDMETLPDTSWVRERLEGEYDCE